MSNDHDEALARAFDAQAPRFERAPVQSDPAALERLVQFAGFPPGSRILDAGCGPGLVCGALLAAGYRVVGVDLSREMIAETYGISVEALRKRASRARQLLKELLTNGE